jgi:hypothetical protein
MPGYTDTDAKVPPKEEKLEYKEEDGTTITVTRSHFKQELLANCLEDFPDAIKKIVEPFI